MSLYLFISVEPCDDFLANIAALLERDDVLEPNLKGIDSLAQFESPLGNPIFQAKALRSQVPGTHSARGTVFGHPVNQFVRRTHEPPAWRCFLKDQVVALGNEAREGNIKLTGDPFPSPSAREQNGFEI